jgi:hypothetical protein
MIKQSSAEGHLRRGATPTAAIGVYYADGKTWLRRGLLAVGVSLYSGSETISFHLFLRAQQ